MQTIPQEEFVNMNFFTADVESLYTNINVNTAIENIIEFATEHRSHLSLYGLTLTDVHELLEISLLNSYFVYDRQVYIQLRGFFMGVRPAPLGAIIKMWKLERLSLYSDLRISMVFYGRFYDDINSTASNKRRAQLMINLIEAEDPDQLIRLTLDYPTTKDDYTPFLNMEAKICEDGNIDTRLYRKPQKKLLTLNSNSHHPTAVKNHTVANMYETADMVSSNEHNKKHSAKMVDELLLNNGYSNRTLNAIIAKKNKKNRKKPASGNKTVGTLKIPYLSDQCTARIKRAAVLHKIPLRVVTTP